MTAIRAGLCAVAAFTVAAHGAVEPWSEAVLVAAAAALLLVWSLLAVRRGRLEIRGNALLVPMLLFGAVVLAQLLAGVTAYPYLTRIELLKLAAYLALFFLAVQVFRTPGQARGLVWFLVVLGFATALFGIVQHLAFNGKLYWVRELRHGGIPFGPYVNRNHFAGLMELLIPLGAALVLLPGRTRAGRDQVPLLLLFTLVPIGALFLSASRGGIASFVCALLLLILLIGAGAGPGPGAEEDPRGRPRRRFFVAAAGFLLLAGGLLLWLDAGAAVLGRFGEISKQEITRDRRAVMARDTWRIFLDHPVLGTGLGTLVAVYPRYESYYDGKVVDHAHNDYLELLAETGAAGGLAALAFLFLLFRNTFRQLERDRLAMGVPDGPAPALPVPLPPLRGEGNARPEFARAVRLGALVACTSLLLHSLVDFNLHLPSHALLFLLLAAVATSAARAPANHRRGAEHIGDFPA